MPSIAPRVRLMAAQNLTSEQIADSLGVRPSYVDKILKRRQIIGPPLSVERMIEMCEKIAKHAPSDWTSATAEQLANELRIHSKRGMRKLKQAGGSKSKQAPGLTDE